MHKDFEKIVVRKILRFVVWDLDAIFIHLVCHIYSKWKASLSWDLFMIKCGIHNWIIFIYYSGYGIYFIFSKIKLYLWKNMHSFLCSFTVQCKVFQKHFYKLVLKGPIKTDCFILGFCVEYYDFTLKWPLKVSSTEQCWVSSEWLLGIIWFLSTVT